MSGRARLLHVHRYYAPDAPPYATMLQVIAAHLAGEGHEVYVVSSMPTYNEASSQLDARARAVEDGVNVHRVRLPAEDKAKPIKRAAIALLFVAAVFVEVLRVRPSLVTFSTMPPIALGLAVRVALTLTGRPGRFVYHCQDLYPEVTRVDATGSAGRAYRLVAAVERSTRRAAAAVIVLSGDMRRTIVAGGARPERVHVINNFSLVEATKDRPARDDQPARIVFAGNMGRFQQLDVIAEAVRVLRQRGSDVEFLFLGDGVARRELEAVAGDGVELRGYVPPTEAFELLQGCDVGLVTLGPGMLDVAYPSKTMTYLAAGCQVVATAPATSALADAIVGEGVGAVVPPADAVALSEAIEDRARLAGPDQARTCSAMAARSFGRPAVLAAWTTLIKSLIGDDRG